MRILTQLALCCLFAGGAMAQRGGGHGGGGGGGIGGHGGGIGGGGIGGGGIGHGGAVGGGFGGFGGYGRGFGYGGFGYGGLYGGFGYGGYWPYYGLGYGYWPDYYPYPAYPYAAPAYSYEPAVNSSTPAVVYPRTYAAQPVMHEYDQYGQEVKPADGGNAGAVSSAPASSSGSGSPVYLIAFQDHSIQAAVAYWLDGKTLHYVTLQHAEKQAPLDTVDRSFSQQLNSARRVQFQLPAQ